MNLASLRQAAEAADRGPWKVFEQEHPHHMGGAHTERNIGTTWDHGQLKGPWPIVTMSTGIGETKGSPVRKMVSIDANNAAHIAAMNPQVALALIAVAEAAKEVSPGLDLKHSSIVTLHAALAVLEKMG